MYRSRKLDERFLEDLPFQSRVALVSALSKDLKLIEDYLGGSSNVGPDLAQDLLAGAQVTAGETVGELIRRYGLVLPKRRPVPGSKK